MVLLNITGIVLNPSRFRQSDAGPDYYDVVGWCSKTYASIDQIYGAGDYRPKEIRMIGLSTCSSDSHTKASIPAYACHAKLEEYIRQIEESGEGSR
jgi:hypothetical protein